MGSRYCPPIRCGHASMDKTTSTTAYGRAFGHEDDGLGRGEGVRTVRQNRRRRPKAQPRHHRNDPEWIDDVLGSSMQQSTETKKRASTQKATKARTRRKQTARKSTRATTSPQSRSSNSRQSTIPPPSAPPSAPVSRKRASAPPPSASKSRRDTAITQSPPTPDSVRNDRIPPKTRR